MTVFRVQGQTCSADISSEGSLVALAYQEEVFHFPLPQTVYELDGQECRASADLGEGGLAFRLQAGQKDDGGTVSAQMEVRAEEGLTLHVTPEMGSSVKRAALHLFFPGNAVFHLAEHSNIGRRLDASMPPGETAGMKLNYNFLVVELPGICVLLRSNHPRFMDLKVEVARYPDLFGIHASWSVESDLDLAVYASLEEAIVAHERWMQSAYAVRPQSDPARRAPEWVQHIPLMVIVDMLRSNWVVSHDYHDTLSLARDLKEIGCPPDTLFYIPGWHGAYDSTHPTYWPRTELGGEEAFRTMVDGIHALGYRVMIHATGWGIDPYHPNIDHLQKLAMRNPDGSFHGWQIGARWLPNFRKFKFQVWPQPLFTGEVGAGFILETPEIPGWCEAIFKVSGTRGAGRLRLTLGRRSVISPPGWFMDHDEFEYPFPLLLQAGKNQVQVEVAEGGLDLSNACYSIPLAFTAPNPYSSWTWPILMADMSNPEYVELFGANLERVIRAFGIDAVHVDATGMDWVDQMPDARPLLRGLQARIPDVPVCSEAVLGYQDFSFAPLSQCATQSLVGFGHRNLQRRMAEQGGLAAVQDVEKVFAWLNQTSPVCDFARRYTRYYPHLCAANAFVPVGKVCNIFPPRKMPPASADLWAVLRDAARLGYIPGLRVNYREYGLDPETRGAVTEICRGAGPRG